MNMQRIYIEGKRIEDKYSQLLKHGKQGEARVTKRTPRSNLEFFCLNKAGNMSPKMRLTNIIWPSKEYFVFRTEPLHLFCPEISKTLKDCTL